MKKKIRFLSITCLLCVLTTALYMLPAPISAAAPTPSASPSAHPDAAPTPPVQADTTPSPAPSSKVSPSPGASPSSQASPAPSPEPLQQEALSEFEAVLQKMKAVNKGLRDYSSTIRVTGMATYSIIDMAIYAEGIYYFKEPDKHRMKVIRGPHYLAQYPQVLGWNLPKPEEWTCKIRESQENGKDYIILKMIPVMGMGDLLKTEMWVDKNSYLFERQIYYYRDGGKMTLDSSYRQVEGFSLFNKLAGVFEFPKKRIKAHAEAEYLEYTINKGIDDSVFRDDRKK